MKNTRGSSWDKYISDIEHDVHGRQDKAYKILHHLIEIGKDNVKISYITENELLT